MNIKGIIRVLNESGEGYFYTTDRMINDNILIEEINVDDAEGNLRTDYNLYYYDDLDAKSFQLGFNELSTPLNVFVMVKEIINIYNTSSLNEFLQIINELSVGNMCSSYQSKEENKIEIRKWIKGYFEEFNRVII